jgi:hypothetical protein
VLAHLKTQETRANPAERRSWKFRLIKGLYDRGLDADQVRLLFKFLDWMMVLPEESEEAKVETLLRLLTKRFKTAIPDELSAHIRTTSDLDKLDGWIDTSLEASNLEEFRRICGI